MAVAVGEGRVEADNGQVVGFQLRLECFEGLARERTFFYFREMLSNLVTGVAYLLAVEPNAMVGMKNATLNA